MNIELSVVILCYRAGKRVYNFVDRTMKLLDSSIPSWEMVLVGNYFENTNDDTPKAIEEISSTRDNIKTVILPKEGMMSWDARMGLSKATGRYICLIDGDEQMPPQDIVRVYKKITEDKLDFVKTFRAVRYDGAERKLVSRIYNFLFKLLFPGLNVKDVNSKPKIFTREALDRMRLESNDWFLDAEMMIEARRLKFKIGEVPTEFYKCEYRKSFVKFNTIFEFIKNLSYARIREFFK